MDISVELAQVNAQVCGLASFLKKITYLSATALFGCKLKGWAPENKNLVH